MLLINTNYVSSARCVNTRFFSTIINVHIGNFFAFLKYIIITSLESNFTLINSVVCVDHYSLVIEVSLFPNVGICRALIFQVMYAYYAGER